MSTAVATAQSTGPMLVEEATPATREQIVRAEAFASAKQWADAADAYRMLLSSPNEELRRLVLSDPDEQGFRTAVPVWQFVNDKLLSLAQEDWPLIEELRKRIDSMAASRLKMGESNRRADELSAIVESMLLSSYGDDVLLRLGDIANQNGHYSKARHWYGMISRQVPSRPDQNRPAFPDTDIRLAEIQARLSITSALEGDFARAERELQGLKRRFPDEHGTIGGVDVDLAVAVQQIITEARQATSVPRSLSSRWPTRSVQRVHNFVSSVRLDPFFHPEWTIELPNSGLRVDWPSDLDVDIYPTIEPTVIGDTLFFADATSIYAFDVNTGRSVSWSDNDAGQIFTTNLDAESGPSLTSLPFQLSSSDDSKYLFAVLDSYDVAAERTVGQIITLDLTEEGRLEAVFSAAKLSETTQSDWRFAGPVLPIGDRQYVAVRSAGGLSTVGVACLSGADLLWLTPIVRVHDDDNPLKPQILLGFSEGTIFVSSHAGATAALDAATGAIHWALLNPRKKTTKPNLLARPWFRFRLRVGPVVDRDWLYVAPADDDRIFAIDKTTGRIGWSTDFAADAFDAFCLIGVTEKDLLVSGRRLWVLDRTTGKASHRFQENPFPRELQARHYGCGRGVVADNRLYWPARVGNHDLVHVFDVATGRFDRQPIDVTAAGAESGNLIVTTDHFIIAGHRRILGFVNDRSANQPIPKESDFDGEVNGGTAAEPDRVK